MKKNRPFSSVAVIMTVVVLTALLIESDYFIYWSITDIFNIISFSTKLVIAVLLLILSLSFIASFIIERYSASKVTKMFYLVASFWMGMLVYLVLASLVYISTYLIFGRFIILGEILFLLALITSIYGFINGKIIKINKIEVQLPNLPEVWRGKTAVWISDFHLGTVRSAKFSEKVKTISNSLSPDIIFIGGDLYDGTHAPDPNIIAEPLKNLTSVYGTYFISGNHEEFDDSSPFFDAVSKLGIKIIKDTMFEVDGLQIIGVDYLNCHNKEKFQKVMDGIKFDNNKASILLKHEPRDLGVGELAGVSFQISGHTHHGQQWPFNHLTNFIYKGYSYGLKHYGSMKVYVSSGVGGWGPQFRVGSNCEVVHITFK